jgi:carbonic anhydrase
MKRLVSVSVSALASIAVLPLLLFALSCAEVHSERGGHGRMPEAECCDAPWSYAGDTGPDRWGTLSKCYEACAKGGEQSPVTFEGAVTTRDLPPLSFRYATSATVQVVNNGHTIKASTPAGSQFSIGTDVYDLQEFHFHTLSEHRFQNAQTPLEMHLVNQNRGGRTAAVGVFIILDPQFPERDNPELEKIWRGLTEYGPEPVPVANINIQALLPVVYNSYRYAGSLTTPACGQGLQWNVLATPIKASRGQIERFKALFAPAGNSRPPQDLNGRVVVKDF